MHWSMVEGTPLGTLWVVAGARGVRRVIFGEDAASEWAALQAVHPELIRWDGGLAGGSPSSDGSSCWRGVREPSPRRSVDTPVPRFVASAFHRPPPWGPKRFRMFPRAGTPADSHHSHFGLGSFLPKIGDDEVGQLLAVALLELMLYS
jgi:hypothetical protein